MWKRTALIAALGLAPLGTGLASVLPTGFNDSSVVAGLDFPVAITTLPDGRVLFTEQFAGRIRLVVNGALAATDPVAVVPDVRNNPGSEQGLLGIAVDPHWPSLPYVYVYYDVASSATTEIARFTVAGDLGFTGNGSLTIDTATRRRILTGLPDMANNHNGGTLRFGPDGMLYASLGDDAASCAAQDTSRLQGKIVRLDVHNVPAGGGTTPALATITPADNPFFLSSDPNVRLVWALGLRNPFRFSIDVDGTAFVGDVGQDTWEEIDRLPTAGLDLGWPLFEGPASFTTCSGVASSGMTAPIYSYSHGSGSYAVIAGPVYRTPACAGSGTNFPVSYRGDHFFSDYYKGFLRRLKQSGGSWSLAPMDPGQPNATDWGTGFANVSDWMLGCDGALWYCKQSTNFSSNTGSIGRITYSGSAGVPSPPGATAVDLRPPWPSPARDRVELDYVLPAAAQVELVILDAQGALVRALVSRREPLGPRHATWDGRDEKGQAVAAGVYFARLLVEGREAVRRFPLIR